MGIIFEIALTTKKGLKYIDCGRDIISGDKETLMTGCMDNPFVREEVYHKPLDLEET